MKQHSWFKVGQAGLLGILCLIVAACTLTKDPQSNIAFFTRLPMSVGVSSELSLPLQVGTTWVYSYMPYDPLPASPLQTMTATYLLTDTVVEVQTKLPQIFAKIQRERRLVWKPPEWEQADNEGMTVFWYVISGIAEIYEPWDVPNFSSFEPEEAIVAFQFPLVVGNRWCPRLVDLKNEARPRIINCRASGERQVVAEGWYETPAGKFGLCYEVIEDYTSGGVTRWFCPKIGVIRASYDHGGTKFGFRQVLMRFEPGSP